MLLKSTLYFIGTYIVLSIALYFLPYAKFPIMFGIIVLLLPPVVTGLLIARLHRLDPSNKERWTFSALMSLLLVALSAGVTFYGYSTDLGRVMIDASLAQNGTSFASTFSIAFAIMFSVWLFCNRIGFAVGTMLGKRV